MQTTSHILEVGNVACWQQLRIPPVAAVCASVSRREVIKPLEQGWAEVSLAVVNDPKGWLPTWVKNHAGLKLPLALSRYAKSEELLEYVWTPGLFRYCDVA